MSNTPNLQLPFLDANQNQKTVTHNAALSVLDILVNCQVQSAALTAPPASPGDGQAWIVASGGTGAWVGKDLNIAAYQDGAWAFYPPTKGMLVYDDALATLLVWTGMVWASLGSLLALLMVQALGIGTAADTGNPLSATLNNALFNALGTGAGGTGDVRIKLNKAAAGNTASFLFQDGFSGRAEIGLTGDDNFHFKVSPDGATFANGITIDRTTGAVTLGNARTAVADASYTALASDRMVAYATLTAARTLTLPSAAGFPPGVPLVIADESGSCSVADSITVACAGSDTVDGVASTRLNAAFSSLVIESDGSGKWTIVAQSTGDPNAAWIPYTPTVTSQVGTITTASSSGFYKKIGTLVFVRLQAAITTNGSGAGAIVLSLPLAGSSNQIMLGRENSLSGLLLQGIIFGQQFNLVTYNNTYPGADGASVVVSGCYETSS